MTVYLWHMAPVVVAAVAFYPTGLLPQPPIGSAAWWGLRAVWVVVLAALFTPLVAALGPLERRRGTPRAAQDLGRPRSWALSLFAVGIPLTAYALSRLALRGFAAGGRLPVTVLAAYCVGVLLVSAGSIRPHGHAGRARTNLPGLAGSR
jgi:hypothetical protein